MEEYDKQCSIIGAGRIGSFYAIKLLTAGHSCAFVARGKRPGQFFDTVLRVFHDERHLEIQRSM